MDDKAANSALQFDSKKVLHAARRRISSEVGSVGCSFDMELEPLSDGYQMFRFWSKVVKQVRAG
jgi:hypothetical protein